MLFRFSIMTIPTENTLLVNFMNIYNIIIGHLFVNLTCTKHNPLSLVCNKYVISFKM